jgi:hypothetical protein
VLSLVCREVVNNADKARRFWEGSHRLPKGPSAKERVRTTRRSAVISDTRSGGEGIYEKIFVVASRVPHGEPEQFVFYDEFALGGERLRVVVGNQQLLGLVVNVGLRKRGDRERSNIV